jgi:hypothetical protein
MKYHKDIFYDTSELSYSDRVSLLNDVYEICNDWWVEQLQGFARTEHPVDSFADAISILTKDSVLNVIHRRGYEDMPSIFRNKGWSVEVSFEEKDFYVWVYADQQHIETITQKYDIHAL